MNPPPMIALKRIAVKCLSILFWVMLSKGLLAQPVVTAFSPTSGAVGSTVTITGSGFDNTISGNVVYFGAVKATVTAASNNSLTVIAPNAAGADPKGEPLDHPGNFPLAVSVTAYVNKPGIVRQGCIDFIMKPVIA